MPWMDCISPQARLARRCIAYLETLINIQTIASTRLSTRFTCILHTHCPLQCHPILRTLSPTSTRYSPKAKKTAFYSPNPSPHLRDTSCISAQVGGGVFGLQAPHRQSQPAERNIGMQERLHVGRHRGACLPWRGAFAPHDECVCPCPCFWSSRAAPSSTEALLQTVQVWVTQNKRPT